MNLSTAIKTSQTWNEVCKKLGFRESSYHRQKLRDKALEQKITFFHFKRERSSIPGFKYCPLCNTLKETKDFSFSKKDSGKRQSHCAECLREVNNALYPRYAKRIKDSNKKNIQRNREYVFNYLLAHNCVDCGESNPVKLEFDHQKDKTANICDLIGMPASIDTLREEISKCEVRCANCHRVKTAADFNYWVYEMYNKIKMGR